MMDYYTNREFASAKFEILSEEDKEIDIQAIRELACYEDKAKYDVKGIGYNRDKINEIVRAIKQLDKKIK